MRSSGLFTTVVGGIRTAIGISFLNGAGVFGKAEDAGGALVAQSPPVPGASSTIATAGPLVPDTSAVTTAGPLVLDTADAEVGDVIRVEPTEAVHLLDIYSLAAGSHDYEAAWSMLSPGRQRRLARQAFEDFWHGIALTGFFPDNDPSIKNVEWREDGAVSITVRLFFDQCKVGTRSVEDVTVVVEHDEGLPRIDQYSAHQIGDLSHEPVSAEVLATCPA